MQTLLQHELASRGGRAVAGTLVCNCTEVGLGFAEQRRRLREPRSHSRDRLNHGVGGTLGLAVGVDGCDTGLFSSTSFVDDDLFGGVPREVRSQEYLRVPVRRLRALIHDLIERHLEGAFSRKLRFESWLRDGFGGELAEVEDGDAVT